MVCVYYFCIEPRNEILTKSMMYLFDRETTLAYIDKSQVLSHCENRRVVYSEIFATSLLSYPPLSAVYSTYPTSLRPAHKLN